ncbi:MAG: hypothetical protein KF845_02990 [Cyclobacteriaceae bacterium]|nr:hypothetical protein [Cyclobacteriaceae bacterium]
MTENKTPIPPQLGEWLSRNRLKIELILTVPALVFYFTVNNQEILMVTMTTLAAFYFLSAYIKVDVEEMFGLIALKVVNISCAVCVLSLLFKTLALEGAQHMMLVGSLSIASGVLIILAMWVKSQNRNYLPFLIRALILGFITGWVFLPEIREMMA